MVRTQDASAKWEPLPGSFTPLSKERATELAESLVEGADAEKLRQLSQRLQGAVLRFVKNGSPSSEEETWPEYCGDKEMTIIA